MYGEQLIILRLSEEIREEEQQEGHTAGTLSCDHNTLLLKLTVRGTQL